MITKMNLPFMAILCACIMLFASGALGFSVSIDISPSTLNLGSEGQWITCTVSFPEPYEVADVHTSSLSLYGVSPYSTGTGGKTLNCKFVRSTFEALLEPFAPGEVELTLSGQMTDGTEFEGTDTIFVNFREYTITSTAGPNGLIDPSGETTVKYGSNLDFTATPGVGYQVDKWYLDGTEIQTGGNTYTLSNIQANHTVHVTFKLLQYVVTSTAAPNGSIDPAGATTVTYGSDLGFTATPGVGYQVDKWSVDGTEVQTGGNTYTLTNIRAVHTVHVTFKLLQYVITPSAGPNGSIDPAGATTVTYGSDLGFTATPSTGFQVDTWSVDGSPVQTGGTSYTLSNIQAVHTVHVTFKLLQYAVTSSAGPNGSVSPTGPTTVNYDDDLGFTATPGTGYQVDKWSLDGTEIQTGGNTYTLSNIQAVHTVHVTFKLLQYVVTPSAGPNGSIDPAGATTVTYGSDLGFTATPGVGYQVDKWSVDGTEVQTGGNTYTLSNIQANHIVHVTFKLLQNVVTSSAGANGSISPTGGTTVTYGSDLAFTATPSTGYQVDTWSVDGSPVQTGGTGYTLSNIQAVHTVHVTFKLLQYVVSPSAGPNGSVSPTGPTTVNYGDNLAFTATPSTGYQVDTWSVDGSPIQTGGTSYTLSNIQAIHTVHVTFKLLQYVVTPSAGPNGSVSPAGPTTVNYGDNLAFTATPSTGFQVDTWSVDGSPVQTGGTSYTFSNIQAVHTVHVTFKHIGHTITPSAGLNGFILPDSPVIVEDDDSQQFTAYPNISYTVDRWYLDGGEVQIGGNTYTLSNIHADHSVYVTFKQKLTYSLNSIEFNDDKEFDTRIVNNNSIDPDQPDKSRTHIVRVVGLGPDPDGVMSMHNLKDLDPTSPNYGQIIHARAKGSFIKTDSDEILIRFKYLFNTSDPGVELVIYLSDSPDLLAHDDPLRQEHYLEVARLSPPPSPRPGSVDSGRFGVFEKIVWAGSLDFNEGTWIELELIEPESPGLYLYSYMPSSSDESEGGSVLIDDWSPAVQCYGICLDINWDNFIDEADFLTVISEFGRSATDDRACLEGVFSNDGTLDVFDVTSWDWAMNSESRLLNFCGVPLVGESVTMMAVNMADFKTADRQLPLANLPGSLNGLLIAGKRGAMDAPGKLKDRLYIFDNNGLCSGWFEPASDRCNIRLVMGANGELYQINSETGVLRLDDNRAIVPPGKTTYAGEPRYNSSATVYVGLQRQGMDSFGRPVFDADFDADYVYVTPVVVNPYGGEPYTATARLELLDGANPPYKVVRLYDDPPLPNDNQYRNYLREIELDSTGSLYVLNVHFLNESNILWRYYKDGSIERLDLGRPDSNNYLPSPIGMYMSDSTDMLYLASALYNPAQTGSAVVYGISTVGALAFERTITINGMHHVTGITEDPTTGSLWIVGFNMEQIPQYPNPFQLPFYYPYLAEVHSDSDRGQAIPLFDLASHDLALPMSVIWTKTIN